MIVVGAGLGGSAAAWQLAQHGLSVLVLEAGAGEELAAAPRRNRQRMTDRLRPILGKPGFSDPRFISYFIRELAESRLPTRP